MDWKRDSYYVTRAGEKVRLIYTEAPGEFSQMFISQHGHITTRSISGRSHMIEDLSNDIVGPWVEPVKPLQVWVNYYNDGDVSTWNNEAEARKYAASDCLRIAVHMREVEK